MRMFCLSWWVEIAHFYLCAGPNTMHIHSMDQEHRLGREVSALYRLAPDALLFHNWVPAQFARTAV